MAREPLPITSLDDERIEVFRDVRDRDLRASRDRFIAESEMVLDRLLERPECLDAILLSTPRWERLRETDRLAALPERVALYVADVEIVTAIAGFHIHRGVLAAGRRPTRAELTPERALVEPLRGRERILLLAVEGISNVDNLGSLFRCAAAFGVDGVLLDPTCCDPLYRKAIRVSMGRVFSVPWASARSWPEDLTLLRTALRAEIVGAEPGRGGVALQHLEQSERMVFVLGAEDRGLSAATLAACDRICEIEMARNVSSLNVATAAAIVLYEHRRAFPDVAQAPPVRTPGEFGRLV